MPADSDSDSIHEALREDVLSRLWKVYPQHCVVLTDAGSRRAIDAGIARAARHGFRRAAEVRPFVSLMIFLGSHFDEDPQLPWAQGALRRRAAATRANAMADLLGEASRQMKPIVGAQGEYYRRALAWTLGRGFDELAATYDDSDEGLRGFLRAVHRRKLDALDASGDERAMTLIRDARRGAERHGLTTPPGVVVYLGLMFLLGSSFDEDPFHPWAGEVLTLSTASDATSRARDLHARAMEILRRYTRLDGLMHAQASKG